MSDAERAALALMVWCGFCWAPPGTACAEHGQHLVRYARAFRRGLIGKHDLAMLCRSLPMVSAGHVVTDPAVPAPGNGVG